MSQYLGILQDAGFVERRVPVTQGERSRLGRYHSASGQQTVPVFVDQVGSAWTRAAQVDVVGINSMEKTLVLGECKWGPEPSGRSVLTELVEKTAEIVPSQDRWQVYYVGFARTGWTAASHAFAQEVASASLTGKNWQALGVRLLDLAQVDHDLG